MWESYHYPGNLPLPYLRLRVTQVTQNGKQQLRSGGKYFGAVEDIFLLGATPVGHHYCHHHHHHHHHWDWLGRGGLMVQYQSLDSSACL